jgi:hypothetical protein
MTSSHRDYIPQNAAEFNDFALNLLHYVEEMVFGSNNPPWDGLIPEARFDEFNMSYTRFARAHEIAIGIPTSANIRRRQKAQKETASIIRALVNQYLRFPPVTDADRIAMRIPNHDTIRTPSPVPTSVPEIETDTSVIRELSMRLRDFGAASWGKPGHVRLMELAWGIREDRPAEVVELPRLESATANPIVLTFEEEQRGKRVYFAARWLNNTAQSGPWSDIESAVIP